MEEYQDSNHNENGGAPAGAGPNRWLTFVLVALLGITAVTFRLRLSPTISGPRS